MYKIQMTGMSCQHCVAAAKEALEDLGLTSVSVDLDSETATFTPTTAFSREQVSQAIRDAGLEVCRFS